MVHAVSVQCIQTQITNTHVFDALVFLTLTLELEISIVLTVQLCCLLYTSNIFIYFIEYFYLITFQNMIKRSDTAKEKKLRKFQSEVGVEIPKKKYLVALI